MSIKIAFFDIDGTLASNTIQSLNIIDRIPQSARESIKKLKESKIIPVISTGRGKVIIEPLLKALDIDTYIASNGLSINYHHEEIEKSVLTSNQIHMILSQIINHHDMTILLETTRGIVLVQQSQYQAYQNHQYILDISHDLSLVNDYEIYQVIVDGQDIKKKVCLNIPELKARMVGPYSMDIYPENMSKAVGIKKLLHQLSIDVNEAIAFGDEENDLEMLKAVGTSVAMGNGNPLVKEIATYVTDSVDDHGIYNACCHFDLFHEDK